MFNFYLELIKEHVSIHGTDYAKLNDFLSTLHLYDFRVDENSLYIQPSGKAEFFVYDFSMFTTP